MAGRTGDEKRISAGGAVIGYWPGAIACLVAAVLAVVVAGGVVAQTRSSANDGPVVYCRDPVRQIVVRSLARDCPAGAVITEKEAEALKNESIERRRRLMFGEKPEAVPAVPVEPVREAPAERAAPPAAPPAVQEPPRKVAAPPAPRPAVQEAKPAPAAAPEPVIPPTAAAPEPAKPQVEAAPRAPKPAAPPPAPAAASKPPAAPSPAPVAASEQPAAPSPAPVRAAAPPPPPPPLSAEFKEVQALATAMKPGEFRAVGKNTMRDVVPHLCNTDPRPAHCAVQGPLAIMSTWGGAAFDTKRNIFLVTGGGHNDYGGNEVYHFRLDTLRWERATDPSPMRSIGNGQFEIADGSEAPISVPFL